MFNEFRLTGMLGAAQDWWREQTVKEVTVYADAHGFITDQALPRQMIQGTNFRQVGRVTLRRSNPLANWKLDEKGVVEGQGEETPAT